MEKDFAPTHLDVQAFARAAGLLEGEEPLARYPRLIADATGPVDGRVVRWSATGERREPAGMAPQTWLHLSGGTVLPMVCQRCLQPVELAVDFDNTFRFVADEATAEAEDDESEEDVLVTRRDFPLHELVEDELLLALPPVPLHEVCPVSLPKVAEDPDFASSEEARAHPFAILAGLQKGK